MDTGVLGTVQDKLSTNSIHQELRGTQWRWTYTLPVNRYPSGIISWSQEEINATDIKTKTLQKSYPEVLWAMESERATISEWWSPRWVVPEKPRAAEARKRWGRRRGTIMHGQALAWDIYLYKAEVAVIKKSNQWLGNQWSLNVMPVVLPVNNGHVFVK